MNQNRKAGVLMHISTLPGNYSIGGFGEESKKFVDFLAEGGFQIWQVLPFCLPDGCHSPYSSYSSFSINPWFISLPSLYEESLLTNEELQAAEQHVPYTCEFKRLEEAIPQLEARISEIEGIFQDPDFFNKYGSQSNELNTELEKLKSELDQASERWLELADRM